jgi:hypothetical protein
MIYNIAITILVVIGAIILMAYLWNDPDRATPKEEDGEDFYTEIEKAVDKILDEIKSTDELLSVEPMGRDLFIGKVKECCPDLLEGLTREYDSAMDELDRVCRKRAEMLDFNIKIEEVVTRMCGNETTTHYDVMFRVIEPVYCWEGEDREEECWRKLLTHDGFQILYGAQFVTKTELPVTYSNYHGVSRSVYDLVLDSGTTDGLTLETITGNIQWLKRVVSHNVSHNNKRVGDYIKKEIELREILSDPIKGLSVVSKKSIDL